MFSSPLVDKENVFGEVFCTTPGRIPLKTVQMVSGNIAAEGTPLAMAKRTPTKPRPTRASTPSSRRLARRLKRLSVPAALSKPLSIFEDDVRRKSMFKMDFEESLHLRRDGPELNEMIRDKVSETVMKMKERYEASLAEKQQDLDDKNSLIEKLQSEMGVLTQPPPTPSQKDVQDKNNVSAFVEEVISKAIQEIKQEDDSLPFADVEHPRVDSVVSKVENASQFEPHDSSVTRQRDVCTRMTPIKFISSEKSPMRVEITVTETSMTPVMNTHSATSVTPVQMADTVLSTSPACVKDSILSGSALQVTDSPTRTSPLFSTDSVASITPEQRLYTPTKSVDELEPKILNVSNETENFLTPIQEEHATEISTMVQGKTVNTTTSIRESCVHVGTSMTPVEFTDKHTFVSPMQTSNVSITTSPLVAALQPEIISSLPPNCLRAELESAAISNELLRSECDDLNWKVEDLQSSLAEARSDAEEKCKTLQDVIDSLECKLEEALEINYQMEMKKPFTPEEYDETISRLQKDILLKEKQITFCTKKASETDNLQKDLRRMYAKYNAEHQLYTTLDDEAKTLKEQYKTKCVEYESLESEVCGVKEELERALHNVDAQDKVREEAKDNQVKCFVLEEQIETFQLQQKENLEFLEQERKGLEETTLELEQTVKTRTEELEATRRALEEKTEHYEQMRETTHELRSELSDVQDELNAVQSQAYLVMLEQEKELTAVSRVLEETWGRLLSVIETYKHQARIQEEYEPTVVQDSEDTSKDDDYKPSFVCSVLAAVSGTLPRDQPPRDEATETQDNAEVMPREPSSVGKESRDLSEDFTLVSRAKAFQELLLELENNVQQSSEHAQMIIQRQVDEINNLEESLCESKQQYEEIIKKMKQELEDEECKTKKVQRENDNKEYEIETLNLQLKSVEQNFDTARERMRELGNRCCALIEQETENQGLNEKLRLVNHELEKVKQDKSCLERQLSETMERLQSLVEASEGNNNEKQASLLQESFTELLNKKLHLERELENLRRSFAKARRENESFTQHNARLENKASILGCNLIRAEEEIFRLDGIVDRFCTATQSSWQTVTPSQDLRDLLKELNIAVENESK